MRTLPDQSIQCCVTSPPYWNMRDYKVSGQIGLEKSPAEFVAALVAVFSEVRRVLKDDGTLWVVIGDCYAGGGCSGGGSYAKDNLYGADKNTAAWFRKDRSKAGLPAKNLVGVPWRLAFSIQDDGWILRQDIIWAKPNPMPESVTDRCTRAHEYIFMFTKSPHYYYNSNAIRNPPSAALIRQVEEGYNGHATKEFETNGVQNASAVKVRIIENARKRIDKQRGHSRRHAGFNGRWDAMTNAEQRSLGSNKRSVWTIPPANYKEAHFATFPADLIEPMILAASRPGDIVLDPFGGSGTTAMVAIQNGRDAILCELNPEYCELARKRCCIQVKLPI